MKNLKIVTSIDDGSIYDLKSAELLSKHKLQGTFYIPSDWESYMEGVDRKPLNYDQFMEINKRFEIGSHTVTHRHLTNLLPDEAEWEITHSKSVLEELTGKPVTKFCYPRGYSHVIHRKMVQKAGYESARGVRVGCFRSDDPYNENTTVHVYDGRKEYAGSWLAYARQMIKMAEKVTEHEQATYHIWWHSWEVNRDDNWDDLDKFLGELCSL